MRFNHQSFLWREKAPGVYVVVSVEPQKTEVYQIRGISHLYFKESLNSSPNYQSVTDHILKTYQVSTEQLINDQNKFFSDMKNAGIFIE